MNRPLTYAERQELVIGYMDGGGRVFCAACTNHGAPMLAHMLASHDDECEGCHAQLVACDEGEALRAEYLRLTEGAA